jgi:hypothetical protein
MILAEQILCDGKNYAHHLSCNDQLYMNIELDQEAVMLLLQDYMQIKNQAKQGPAIKQDMKA